MWFLDSNVYFKFLIQEKGWIKLCEHPLPGIAPVVREFHSNQQYWMDSIVYVRGKWVDFSATSINRVFNLVEDDSEAYRALFQHMMMHILTNGRGVWKRHPSTSEVTTFLMSALKPVLKAWYNFIFATLKPSHLSTVTRDKTILLFALVRGIKFDVGHVIKRGIIESTQGRCTRALIHPSLIPQLCRLAEVPMLESKEKSPHKLPVPLPKTKNGSFDDMEDAKAGQRKVVGEQAKEESRDDEKTDESPRGHMHPQLQ